jgi:AGZA family xanthine/uracil permease-like MFS transporter
MERFFKLKANGTTVKTEIIAGLTTFFAMAYIIFVNPSYLSQAGMDYTAVLVATCVSAAIGCFMTAFLANVPFAQAPGMGLNAFFTFSVCFGMGYTWQQALTIVLLSGILFLIIMISPVRGKIIESIPASLKAAISAGIGLFICFIGLLNADIVKLIGGGFKF